MENLDLIKQAMEEKLHDSGNKKFEKFMIELNMLSAVFDSMGDAAYFTDTHLRVIGWNSAAEQLTGYTFDEVIGKPCCDFLKHTNMDGEEMCDNKCPLLRSMNEGKDVLMDEVWLRTKEGELKLVEISCSAVHDKNGKLLGSVEIFRDRTRRKELEQMKEEFMATITHDLKSPLSSIMGFTELLADTKHGDISSQKLDFVKRIRRAGNILLGLINNIVEASRIEAGQVHCLFEDFRLDALFEELYETYEPLAIIKDITLNFSCPENLWVFADQGRIRQVFYNLVSNALSHTKRGGTIAVKAESRDNNLVEMEVSDTGVGIPESEKEKVFQKFAQIHAGSKGTGLGLYIVKNLLEAHGSEIIMESEEGNGTRFVFSLLSGTFKAKPVHREGRMLIAEKSLESARLASIILREDGHSVDFAGSGMEALQKASLSKPDIIIVGSDLPDLTIEEFRYSCQRDPEFRNIPVILISTFCLPEWKDKFAAIIPMPFSSQILCDTVQNVLAS